MATSQTGIRAHDLVVDAAESMRQVAVAAAANQAAARAAEIVFYRACLASAKVNNPSCIAVYVEALYELGTGGS